MSENLQAPPLLTTFYLYLTSTCNLACRHCWITPGFSPNQIDSSAYMDLGLLRDAVKQAKPLGLQNVKLTGGEPVLHPQFYQILKLLAQEEIGVVIESNGTLITDTIARQLAETLPKCFVSVSLDGSSEKLNDDLRGVKGAFTRAVKGVKNLVQAGIPPQVIMSIHRGNIDNIDSLVSFAAQIGAQSVKFNPITNSGRGTKMGEKGELLSYDETMTLKKYIMGDLQKVSPLPLFIMIPPALTTVSEILNRPFGFSACRILNILGILSNGEMALCGIGRNIPELCFGKLGQDRIEDIWLNTPVLKRIRRVIVEKDYPDICKNCIHASQCLLHCMAQNYLDFNDLVHPSALCVEAEKRSEFPDSRRRVLI